MGNKYYEEITLDEHNCLTFRSDQNLIHLFLSSGDLLKLKEIMTDWDQSHYG